MPEKKEPLTVHEVRFANKESDCYLCSCINGKTKGKKKELIFLVRSSRYSGFMCPNHMAAVLSTQLTVEPPPPLFEVFKKA